MRAAKLLALDLDGTLIAPGHDHVATADVAALNAIAARNVLVVIATGRSIRTTARYAGQLPVNAPWILNNGALTVEWPGPAIVGEALLDVAAARRAVTIIREFRLSPLVFDGPRRSQKVYVERATDAMERFLALNPARVKWVSSVDTALDSPPILVSAMGPRAVAEQAADRLRSALGGAASVIAMSNGRYGQWSVEVQSPACRKDLALQGILETRGIRPQAVVAIGDEVNDVEMLKLAGFALAMAHSRPEVRDAADEVIVPTDQGRIRDALTRHILSAPAGRTVSSRNAD